MARSDKFIANTLRSDLGKALQGIRLVDLDSILERYAGKRVAKGDFGAGILMLASSVMKANGKVLKTELSNIKRYFIRRFGVEETRDKMLLLREMIKYDFPLQRICSNLDEFLNRESKKRLMHFLYGIPSDENYFHPEEIETLDKIARCLRVSLQDYKEVKQIYIQQEEKKENDLYYRILNLTSSASNDDIKRAYKRLAIEYHPDKVYQKQLFGFDLTIELQKAKRRFQQFNEAYLELKVQRGFV